MHLRMRVPNQLIVSWIVNPSSFSVVSYFFEKWVFRFEISFCACVRLCVRAFHVLNCKKLSKKCVRPLGLFKNWCSGFSVTPRQLFAAVTIVESRLNLKGTGTGTRWDFRALRLPSCWKRCNDIFAEKMKFCVTYFYWIILLISIVSRWVILRAPVILSKYHI